MKTTLHNHVHIEKDGKPLIPNVIWKSLLILIDHKDFEAAKYIVDCYSLVPDQISFYNYKMQQSKV